MRKLWFSLFVAICGLVISACHTKSEMQLDETVAVPLFSYNINADSIVFEALASGCSHNQDFAIRVDSKTEKTAKISIIRLKADHCRKCSPIKASSFH
ncbi:hypothetical protein [Vibrio hepatarius]|uniref:hypothetical protein n=1 Tax=Vibrio hepatarius TaxID=171383 RepID=UPI001C08B3B8|nr:hypothetical protein [Vibrio hepatarius]MBU2895369.1 hypothetical protein [Vibrio hepatarius]